MNPESLNHDWQKLELLSDKINQAARRVDDFLFKFIMRDEQVPNLHKGMIYALGLDKQDVSLRGKRLRPALGLLVCEALGGDPEILLPFATALEIFHNFTLVHDDIEDGDTYRRNRQCVYVKFGLAHGVNIGDYMFVKVFRLLMEPTKNVVTPERRLQLLELMIESFEHTHIGQALDINARQNHHFNKEDYFRIVTEKTGYCLAAPMIAAAILTQTSSKIRKALTGYSRAIGPLFQIRDDVIDLTEKKGRKCIGSDVKEGKRSFLVAHTSERCTDKERQELYRILDLPREETSSGQVDWVRDLFKKYESFSAARKENERLLTQAFEALRGTPESLGNLLKAFAGLLLQRKK